MAKRELSVPEKHQLKIARGTLRMSDVGARIMGGMTKAEARAVIERLTGSTGWVSCCGARNQLPGKPCAICGHMTHEK